ncbi:2Fe-2S iron-sulfur cluster-binding protein [Haloparvum alkalitolerans]|uniref:2Fe-2S iron-sulfur cluster-binding protein n=1 Tax=Haloparvum alkalitolerans TaxID=1042953 RepID=UPI003CE67BDE
MYNPLAIALAAGMVLVVVFFSNLRGSGWEPAADISAEVLEHRASTVPETEFPEPMNRSIGGGGGAAAVGEGAEGEEGELAEGGAEEESGPGDIPEDEVEYYEVEFVKQGETVELANNEPILDQGEEQGWDLPYACRQGQCVSCAGQITDGPSEDFVVHDDQQMLEEAEIDDGYTLTCVAYPRDSFSIETGEAP